MDSIPLNDFMAMSDTQKESLVCVQINEFKYTNAPIVNGYPQCSTGHCTFYVLNGKKTCPQGFGHRRNESSSRAGSNATSISDSMFDAMAKAEEVRNAAKQVLIDEQKRNKEYVKAEIQRGNIKETSIFQRAWTSFSSLFGKLSPLYVLCTLCVCVCVYVFI